MQGNMLLSVFQVSTWYDLRERVDEQAETEEERLDPEEFAFHTITLFNANEPALYSVLEMVS